MKLGSHSSRMLKRRLMTKTNKAHVFVQKFELFVYRNKLQELSQNAKLEEEHSFSSLTRTGQHHSIDVSAPTFFAHQKGKEKEEAVYSPNERGSHPKIHDAEAHKEKQNSC